MPKAWPARVIEASGSKALGSKKPRRKSGAPNCRTRYGQPCSQNSKMHTEISVRRRIRSTATAVALLSSLLLENRAVATTAVISSASATTAASVTSAGTAKLVAAQVETRDFTWFPFPDVGTLRWREGQAEFGQMLWLDPAGTEQQSPGIREDRHQDSRG
jgi:hypothetical protein